MNRIHSLVTLLVSLVVMGTINVNAKDVTPLNEGWGFKQAALIPWGVYPNIRIQKCDTTLNLPHTWNDRDFMSDRGYRKGEGSYEKKLRFEASDRGKRIFVRFEGVSQKAVVFCNYKKVGEHRNAYTGFTVELTDQIEWGKENTLTVICDNTHDLTVAPISGDFNIYGGIYRDVYMETTAEGACISPLYYGSNGVLVHQRQVDARQARLQAEIHLSTTTDYKDCEVEFVVCDAEGHEVASQTSTAITADRCVMDLTVARPHLWQGTADPYLYRVVAVLRRGGREIDRVEDKTGLRSIAVDADRGFFLNGRHVKLHGVSRHQEWAGVATALTRREHDADLEMMADMGVDAVRMAHYPQAPYMLDECDRRGWVVWEEIPFVNNYIPSQAFDDNLRTHLREMIYQNYNHPSVCFWGIFNEVSGGHDRMAEELNRMVHELDSSRLSTSATCFEGNFNHISDVLGWNKYFGWYEGKASELAGFLDKWHKDYPQSRLSVSEYGAGSGLYQHVARGNEASDFRIAGGRFHPMENQTLVHHHAWQAIRRRDFVWGSFVWNMFDFGSSLRTEGEANNLNDKGLVSHDRRVKKDAYYFYRANWNTHEPTTYLASKGYTERREDVTDVVAFVSDGQATLYLNGRKVSTQKADDVKTVVWKDVKLSKGDNTVTVRSKSGTDRAVWRVM